MKRLSQALVRAATALGLAIPISIAAQAPAAPCTAAEAAQFDFWIGDWDVFTPDGKLAGTNRIARLYGCVLHESWQNPKVQGQSFNVFDADRGLWHQTWIDSTGSLLVTEGALRNGAMVLSDATLPGKKDAKQVNEITWTPMPDGSVRQHWRVSADGGKTWTTSFDGRYVRAKR